MKDKFFKRFAIAVLGASLMALPALISGIETGTGTNQTANLYATNSITLRGSAITNWQELPAAWSYYVAGSNVNLASKELTNVSAMTLGGERRTNWPGGGGGTGDVSTWSYYPAASNVDLSSKELTNVAAITLGNARQTNWPGIQIISKTADENVTSSTTLQADDALYFTMAAGKTYVFEFRLMVSNNNSAGPDWKAAIYCATASSALARQAGQEPTGTSFPQSMTTNVTTPGTLVNSTIAADANIPFEVWIQGIITDNGSAGTVYLEWAQNTSDTSALTVIRGSYAIVQKVN